MNFKSKVAVVTGGAQGIGKCIAAYLAGSLAPRADFRCNHHNHHDGGHSCGGHHHDCGHACAH